MKFRLPRLIRDEDSLKRHIDARRFVTYANLYSLRAGRDFIVNFHFVADGWPLRLFASHKLNENVSLLSFYRVRHFWHEIARTKRCLLVGHSPSELANINDWIRKSSYPQFETLADGFRELEELEAIIKNLNHDGIDIIFLALSQPKQEQLMARLSHLEGKVSIVACGAHWLQEAGMSIAPSRFLSNLGVYGLVRSWRSPRRLYLGTVGAFLPLFRNLLMD